jgi:hypothetical protein
LYPSHWKNQAPRIVAAPPSAMMVAAAAIGRVRVRLVQVSSVVAVIV